MDNVTSRDTISLFKRDLETQTIILMRIPSKFRFLAKKCFSFLTANNENGSKNKKVIRGGQAEGVI